jgi:hypothetical protein
VVTRTAVEFFFVMEEDLKILNGGTEDDIHRIQLLIHSMKAFRSFTSLSIDMMQIFINELGESLLVLHTNPSPSHLQALIYLPT